MSEHLTRFNERDLLVAVMQNDSKEGQRLFEALGLIPSMSKKDFEEFWEFFSAQHTPLLIDQPFHYSRPLIRQRIRMAQGFRKSPMTRVTRALFWDVFTAMSANAIRGDLGSTANWRKHMAKILKESGAKARF